MTDEKMAKPPGLSLHGKSWRITKRIPCNLQRHYPGKTLLRFTTGFSDKQEAAVVAWRWLAELEEEFDRLRKTGRPEKTSIAPADLQWLVGSMLSSTLGAHEEGLREGAEEGHLSVAALESLREAARAASSGGDFSEVRANAWLLLMRSPCCPSCLLWNSLRY